MVQKSDRGVSEKDRWPNWELFGPMPSSTGALGICPESGGRHKCLHSESQQGTAGRRGNLSRGKRENHSGKKIRILHRTEGRRDHEPSKPRGGRGLIIPHLRERMGPGGKKCGTLAVLDVILLSSGETNGRNEERKNCV